MNRYAIDNLFNDINHRLHDQFAAQFPVYAQTSRWYGKTEKRLPPKVNWFYYTGAPAKENVVAWIHYGYEKRIELDVEFLVALARECGAEAVTRHVITMYKLLGD